MLKKFLFFYLLLLNFAFISHAELPLKQLQNHIPFNENGPNVIGYLYIGDHQDMISESTWLYVKQGLEYYKKNRPLFIILELDTPGGEVFAAQKISDALKEMDTQESIPVVTFINNWAISAGAMLAYSSRFITTSKDGTMGAAEPVYAGSEGKLETASEKVNSALRADFRSRANFFGRNPLIAEAMVDKDLILVLRNGKIIHLDNESQLNLSGSNPDQVISPKGKLLTLTAEQMLEYGVADLVLQPAKLNQITLEEKKTGIWPANKMLLFQAPFFNTIPQASVHAYKMDWKTHFFVFLASPLVSSLLFMGLIVGGYMEFNHPGFSFPGFVAGACLFLIILSSLSLEIAGWLELIILLTGIVFILIEIFLFPTFGLLGILGILLFLGGIFGMLLPDFKNVNFEYDTQTLNAAGQYFFNRLAWLSGALIISVALIIFLAKHVLPSFTAFNPLILTGHEQESSKGYVAGLDQSAFPLPGTNGEVYAALRPAGKVIINGEIYNALSTGEYISAGEKIVILQIEEGVIFVEKKK